MSMENPTGNSIEDKSLLLRNYFSQYSTETLKQELAEQGQEHFLGICPDHDELGFDPTEEEMKVAIEEVIDQKEVK
jgi:hypothetical protein